MGKYEKLITLILRGASDANIAFNELRHLMIKLGFEERIRGSNHIFRKSGIPELINLQREGNKAKSYQVAKVRKLILSFHLRLKENA